jgi:hypothetical protein
MGSGIQHFLKDICGPSMDIGYDMGTSIRYKYVCQNGVSVHPRLQVLALVYSFLQV